MNFILTLSLLIFLPTLSEAVSAIQSVKGASMAGAFTAAVDDPSAVVANPAALVDLSGKRVAFNATALSIDTHYRSPEGIHEETKSRIHLAPAVYISSDTSLKDVVFGLGISSPHGIGGRKWNKEGLTRYVTVESSIVTMAFQPVVAWRLTPKLSIGGGPFALYARKEDVRMLDQSLLGAADATASFEGDGWGCGYDLGFLWKPTEKVKVGFNYLSRSRVTFEGDARLSGIAPAFQPLLGGTAYKTDAEMTMTFPDKVNLGVSFHPGSDFIFEVGATLVRWSVLDRVKLKLENEVPLAGVTSTSIDYRWKDAWSLQVGVDYRLSPSTSFRCGYGYSTSPVPEKTFSPSAPEGESHMLAAGLGLNFGETTLDFSYTPVLSEERRVTNTILSGKYRTVTHLAGLSLSYRF